MQEGYPYILKILSNTQQMGISAQNSTRTQIKDQFQNTRKQKVIPSAIFCHGDW